MAWCAQLSSPARVPNSTEDSVQTLKHFSCPWSLFRPCLDHLLHHFPSPCSWHSAGFLQPYALCCRNQTQCIYCTRKLKWDTAIRNPSSLHMPVLSGAAASPGCSAGKGMLNWAGPCTRLPGSRESTMQEGMEILFWENSDQRASSEHWSQKAEDQIIEGSGKFPRTLGPGRNTSLPA